MKIAVIILTYNEEIHIARAINSISSFADKILIVDSYSTDRTVEIAREFGAEVLEHPFKNHADQFQWGQDQVDPSYDWIMRLDADEIIEPDLAERIRTELPQLAPDIVGVAIDRKHIFLDRWIRHGGRYPLILTRIFRYGNGRIEQRWMDEHIVVERGRIAHFSGGFADYNLNDLTFFTDKHNKYATREAIDVLGRRHDLFSLEDLSSKNTSIQASFKRIVKENIYNIMPIWMGPFGYFLYRYFIHLGFLDGREGLIYHVLQGFWYRFLVASKVFEYERELNRYTSRQEKLACLERLTGHSLTFGG